MWLGMSKHFVITGPESTGKSTLAKLLAKEYGASLKVEYAREYLTKMTSPYIFDDVIVMAREQLKIEQNCDERLTFFDTDLTVFNVWIKEKYGKEIDWINKSLVESKGKTYLLCNVVAHPLLRSLHGRSHTRLHSECTCIVAVCSISF